MYGKILILICMALIGPRIYKYIILMGYHKHIYNHKPGPCSIIPGVVNGSEDIVLLSNGLAVISSGLTFMKPSLNPKDKNPKLLLFDFNKPGDGVHTLKIDGALDEFNPHGLSSWEDQSKGLIHIFVVNHRRAGDSFEIFQLNQKTRTLHLLRTIQGDPSIRFANDLVATGPESFYFTNYLHYPTHLELYLLLGWSSIGYFDGKKGSIVASGSFNMLNGINMSPDGRYIYASHILDQEILIFERRADNTLNMIKTHPIYTIADNIEVDKRTGDLWLGCHAVGYRTIKYMEDKSALSPSQILRLQLAENDVTDITEVYMDDGREFSASTIAVRYGDKMLVGSVNSKLMVCELKFN